MEYRQEEVLNNTEVSKDIYIMKIKGKFSGKPGQFYMLRAWEEEPLLSRPISIYNIDEEGIEFLYLVKGRGTKILSKLKKNNKINLLGPLGNGFPIDKISGKVALVSGGVGVAPLYYLAKNLKNCHITLFSGFKDRSYAVDCFKDYVENIEIATESGLEGSKGFVTENLNTSSFDMVLTCGPSVMMDKVLSMCRVSNTEVYMSFENKMACGVGACLCCTCNTKNGMKRTCKDGPVFSGYDLN